MRTRLLGLAVAAAATASLAMPAQAAALYDHACRGPVDTNCYTYYCIAVDCFRADCAVYTNLVSSTQARCWG